MDIKWTKPYFGITHIANCPRPWQITKHIYSNESCTLYLLHIGSVSNNIKADHTNNKEVHCTTEEEATAIVDEWMKIAINEDRSRKFLPAIK
jgi:hypothetical protein